MDDSDDGNTTPEDSVNCNSMVPVPAGSFWRGCNADFDDWCESEADGAILYNVPYRELELSEFWIDTCEVTVEDYQDCGAAGACSAPGGVPWSDFVPPEMQNLPVTGVSWRQADEYCKWRDKRLPTEAEWEKAARGTDGRLFPWGNDLPECGRAHLLLDWPHGECERTRHELPVDAHPGDISPYGAIGMIGNVQEWVHDWAAQSYYETAPFTDPPGPDATEAYRDDYKIVRGGYWDYPAITLGRVSVSLRRWGRLDRGYPGRIGFRCASSEAP